MVNEGQEIPRRKREEETVETPRETLLLEAESMKRSLMDFDKECRKKKFPSCKKLKQKEEKVAMVQKIGREESEDDEVGRWWGMQHSLWGRHITWKRFMQKSHMRVGEQEGGNNDRKGREQAT